MKNVIVTGANGFIGTALLKELSKRGVDILAIVRNENSHCAHIKEIPHVTVVYHDMADIRQLPDVLPQRGFDACFHLAWEGSYGAARADYTLQLRNVAQTLDMIDVAAALKVERFIGIGTLAEKDICQYLPLDGATPAPVSIYGIAKLTTHYMTKARCAKHGMPYIWCTLSNTYGVGNTTNNFVNMACKKMLLGERAAFTSGEQMYDLLYITDAANGLANAAAKGVPNTDYFVGSTSPRPLKDYIRQIRDAIDPQIPLYLGEVPFHGIPLPPQELSTAKLEADTNYTANVPFEKGIRETIQWLKETTLH